MSLIRFRRGPWGNLIDSDFFKDDDFFGNRPRRRLGEPALNIKETDTSFEVELAVPGFSKEDFDVTIEDGCLHVSAESSSSKKKEEDNYTRQEFSYNSFQKSLQLPDSIKEEDIKAKYKDGVLRFNLLKSEESQAKKPKKIEIK